MKAAEHDKSNAPPLLLLEQARKIVFEALAELATQRKSQLMPIKDAHSSVLAKPVFAPIAVPGFDNSAMDGFALCASDIVGGQRLQISQRITAGKLALPLHQATAARIFTGAMIPENADTVIAQEDCVYDEHFVWLPENILTAANIRKAGQDIEKGSLVFSAGRYLRSADVGLLASLGLQEVEVFTPLRIALVSTGDELMDAGELYQQGKIYNSNQPLLRSLLERLGMHVSSVHVLADDLSATREMFAALSENNDCMVSTGGVSVGEEDYVKQVLSELGEIALWRLAIKPGKPLVFGHIAGTPFFGLPGNPVSVFVNFLLLLKPALQVLQGVDVQSIERQLSTLFFRVQAAFDQKANKKRADYLRVSKNSHPEFGDALFLYPNQSSGVLSSISYSDGLAVMDIGKDIQKGDWLSFIPFEGSLS